MIYLCNGIGQILSAPCKLLEAMCSCMTGCSDKLCANCNMLGRPCAGFAIMTLGMSLMAVAALAVAAGSGTPNIVRECVIFGVIAAFHICFAFYLQSRMQRMLDEEAHAQGARYMQSMGQGQQVMINPNGQEFMPEREMLNKFTEILKYDIVFLLYFFFSIGTLVFFAVDEPNWRGKGRENLGVAASLLAAIPVLGIAWTVLWWCVTSCGMCCACFNQCCAGMFKPKSAQAPVAQQSYQGQPMQQQMYVQQLQQHQVQMQVLAGNATQPPPDVAVPSYPVAPGTSYPVAPSAPPPPQQQQGGLLGWIGSKLGRS